MEAGFCEQDPEGAPDNWLKRLCPKTCGSCGGDSKVPECIKHCDFENDNCPSQCDTSECSEDGDPSKSDIDAWLAKNCGKPQVMNVKDWVKNAVEGCCGGAPSKCDDPCDEACQKEKMEKEKQQR